MVSQLSNYCPTCCLKVIFDQLSLNAGHVFAFGETRATAIANMVLGLKELHIRGEIHTNVDYTVDLLHVSDYFPMSCRLHIRCKFVVASSQFTPTFSGTGTPLSPKCIFHIV